MKHAIVRQALIAGLATCAFQTASALEFNEPSYDFGTIDTFEVFREAPGPIYQKQTDFYVKELTFTLAEDTSVRIDMRTHGIWSRYSPSLISNVALDVRDASGAIVGTAVDDPTYTAGPVAAPGCSMSSSCSSDKDTGLTFAGMLQAGTYSIKFSGETTGSNFGPEIRIGVAKNSPELMDTYLREVTPYAVPEPASVLTMGIGLLALAGLARRRNLSA